MGGLSSSQHKGFVEPAKHRSGTHYFPKARWDGQIAFAARFYPDKFVEKNKCLKCDAEIKSPLARCEQCGYEIEKCPACSRVLYRLEVVELNEVRCKMCGTKLKMIAERI